MPDDFTPMNPDALRQGLKRHGVTVDKTLLVSLPQQLRDALGTLIFNADKQKQKNANQAAYIGELDAELSKDKLTGLPSGGALQDHLIATLARRHNLGPRQGQRVREPPFIKLPVTLVWVDLDDFGKFAKKYSDYAADLALKHFARTMRGTYNRNGTSFSDDEKRIFLPGNEDHKGLLREADIIGRVHTRGDEFAIIMYNITPPEADIIMTRAQREFEKTSFTYDSKEERDQRTGDVIKPAGTHSLRVSFTYGLTQLRSTDTIGSLQDRASGECSRKKKKAGIDVLTATPNGFAAKEYLDALISNMSGQTAPVSVISVDINDLRRFNEVHGEEAGDLAVKHVATYLRQELGDSAYIARSSGERFMLVMQDCDEATAREKIERALYALQTHGFDVPIRDVGGNIESYSHPTITAFYAATQVQQGDTTHSINTRMHDERARKRGHATGGEARDSSSSAGHGHPPQQGGFAGRVPKKTHGERDAASGPGTPPLP